MMKIRFALFDHEKDIEDTHHMTIVEGARY